MSQTEAASLPQAPTRIHWIVLAIVAFASASAYLTRYCLSAANTTIQADLGFDDVQMGQLMSGFALGYLLFQVPGGWLGNRLGTRFAFAALSAVWSLSNLWSAVASAFSLMWTSRFFLGVFQAGLTPISAKIIKDWMPLKVRGFSSSLIGAAMSVGGAMTLGLTGWLLTQGFGWRMIFAVYSIVGIVWAIGFSWYFRTDPADHAQVNAAELEAIRQGEQRRPTTLSTNESEDERAWAASDRSLAARMLHSPEMWGICIQAFFRAAGYAFFVTWFFAYLEYAYQISKARAGLLNTLPLIAVVIGSLCGGVIIDLLYGVTGSKWISRSGTAIASLGICGLLTMASAWTSSAWQLSAVMAVGALFSGIGNPAAWAATIDIGGRSTAVAMAVMNMAGGLATVILPVILGNWFARIREGGGDWSSVIYLHAAFYFVGAASWLLVNPNREIS